MSKFIAFILGMFVVAILWSISWGISIQDSFDVLNIPDSERWNDLNNQYARNRFCQAMNYQSGKISEYTIGGIFVRNDAGSPYGYDIYCIRSVEEHQIYDYTQYKKWLISLEITNKT